MNNGVFNFLFALFLEKSTAKNQTISWRFITNTRMAIRPLALGDSTRRRLPLLPKLRNRLKPAAR
jgi:hypothetical protein